MTPSMVMALYKYCGIMTLGVLVRAGVHRHA